MITAPQSGKVLTRVLLVLALTGSLFLVQAWAQLPSSSVPKYVDPLLVPSPMPQAANNPDPQHIDYYEIAERPFLQQMLPTGFPQTPVWGFGPKAATQVCSNVITTNCFHTPSAPILATVLRPVRVLWINDLEIGGKFVTYPSGVPLNTDVHWANPPQTCNNGPAATDCKGNGGNYFGPVPTVVHLHGAASKSESDGIPEAWNLPAASTAGFSTATYFPNGSDYCQIDRTTAVQPPDGLRAAGCLPPPNNTAYLGDGTALFQYPNSQNATTLFFHDHALGATTENVYTGLVGPYVLRGTTFPPFKGTPPPTADLPPDCGHGVTVCPDGRPSVPGGLPGGQFEIPLAIQDRSFNTDGSLLFSEGGNMIVVNGKTWPFLNVEPRRYRFRLVISAPTSVFVFTFPDTTSLNFTQIGNDGGFLPTPASVNRLSLAPGERADVIVDFSGFKGQNIILLNDNGGGDTGLVMQFRVGNTITGGIDTSAIPATLPARQPITGTPIRTRQVTLFDNTLGIFQSGTPISLRWDDPVTETPVVNTTEIWEMWDYQDSHPMHLHEVQFQVLNREKMSCVTNHTPCPRPPSPGEAGFKDTVVTNGGEVTRVKVQFQDAFGQGRTGLFAWHCHINPHEDNEMMRPMCVLNSGQSTANAENFCH